MQTFKLSIDAESPDGNEIKLVTSVRINCSSDVATAIVARLLTENQDLKDIILLGVTQYLSEKYKRQLEDEDEENTPDIDNLDL